MATETRVQRCVTQFAEQHATEPVVNLMVDFCDVERTTIERWLNNKQHPRGAPQLQLRAFLELFGYQPQDPKAIPEPTRRMVRLIAFGVISLETARQKLKYKKIQTLYAVLLQGGAMQGKRVRELEQLTADDSENMELLGYAVEEWQRKLERAGAAPPVGDSEPASQTLPPTLPETVQAKVEVGFELPELKLEPDSPLFAEVELAVQSAAHSLRALDMLLGALATSPYAPQCARLWARMVRPTDVQRVLARLQALAELGKPITEQ